MKVQVLCLLVCMTLAGVRSISVPKHVIVLGIDGLGQIYLENATYFLPGFNHILNTGTSVNRARNRFPTVSAPNWSTVITGMTPEDTGIWSNDWTPAWTSNSSYTNGMIPPASGEGKIPTPIWSVIKSQQPNMTVAVTVSWSWIGFLALKDVDYLVIGGGNDMLIKNTVIDLFTKGLPNFLFIHLNNVDSAGHSSFWGSQKYYDAVRDVDIFLQTLLSLIDGETLLFVTADHGGWRSSHDYMMQATMYVPFILYGPALGVPQGVQLAQYVTNVDIAPTLLELMGLKPGKYMQGHSVVMGPPTR